MSSQSPLESAPPFIALALLASNSFWSLDSGSSAVPPPMWAHATTASLRVLTEKTFSVGQEGLWVDKELRGQ